MKLMHTLVAASALATTAAFAAPFNAEELAIASKAGADEFKAEVGEAAYNKIFGLQASQAASGGRVKVFYKDAQDQTRTAEFACHYHEANEIDCHAL